MSRAQDKAAATPLDGENNGQTPPSPRFEGHFVSMIGNHMVIANNDGQKCPHTLARHAKLTCDGIASSTENLKAGGRIRVTTQLGDRNVVIGIESLDQQTEFTP